MTTPCLLSYSSPSPRPLPQALLARASAYDSVDYSHMDDLSDIIEVSLLPDARLDTTRAFMAAYLYAAVQAFWYEPLRTQLRQSVGQVQLVGGCARARVCMRAGNSPVVSSACARTMSWAGAHIM